MLSRKVWDYPILQTIDDEAPPDFVVRRGQLSVAEWEEARDLGRELQRMAQEKLRP